LTPPFIWRKQWSQRLPNGDRPVLSDNFHIIARVFSDYGMVDPLSPWNSENDAANCYLLWPDASRSNGGTGLPKVFLRTLLFSTSKRGRVIESMDVALSRNEMHQNFNIWVYERENLVRGSGLFVAETGVSSNDHFLAPKDGSTFSFIEGHNKLDIFIHLLGDLKPILVFTQELDISRDMAMALREKNAGLYFDWGPDSSRYLPHVEKPSPSPYMQAYLRAMELAASDKNG